MNTLLMILDCLASGLFFRIRGGLRIPFTDKKFPLCKWYFATWFACFACILKGWTLNRWAVMFVASRMATWICGWGEGVGCALGLSKPDKDRLDYLDFDEFCDNFGIDLTIEIKERTIKIWKWTIHIPHIVKKIKWRLIDHPQLFGVVWLTLRGLLLTFLIGLATNSVFYMVWGAPMGVIYWLSGWFARNVKNDGKGGWYYAEFLYGSYLAAGAFLW